MPQRNLEKLTQNAIERYLALYKYFYWKNNTGALKAGDRFIRFGATGSPDIFVFKDKVLYGLEIKSPTGEQRPEQKVFEEMMLANGARYHVVQSLDDVQALGF